MGLLSQLGLNLPGLGLGNPFSDILGLKGGVADAAGQSLTPTNPLAAALASVFQSHPTNPLTSMAPGTTAPAYDPSGLPPLDPSNPMAPITPVKPPAMFVPPVEHPGQSGGIPESYYNSIRSAESGGNDTAKNPTSSAYGRYQFLGSTWNQVAAAHPELGLTANGRSDPGQQEKAIRAFTQDNANSLQSSGVPITGGSLYAAHFLGAGGAKQVYRNPDNAAMSDVVGPGVISANGFLRGMSVGQFKQWAEKKGGGGSGGANYGPTSDAMSRPSGSQWSPAYTPSEAGGITVADGANSKLNTVSAGKRGGGFGGGSSGGSEAASTQGGRSHKNSFPDYKRYAVRKDTSHLRALSPVATLQALANIGKGLQAEGQVDAQFNKKG